MRQILKGATDQSVVIRIVDSGDGTPETGVVFNTAGIDLWYRREGAVKTSITEATLSALNDAHSDGGILHIGDGYYRLDLPDAAVATGSNGVMVGGTVTGMVVIGTYVHLVDYNPQSASNLGLSSLPDALPDAADGLVLTAAFQARTLAAADYGTAANQVIIAGYIDTEIGTLQTTLNSLVTTVGVAGAGLTAADDAVIAAIGALSIPTADQNAAALLDLAAGVETGLTLRQAMRLLVAAEASKLSGAATTTIVIRNFGDSKNRITATVDADGNRSAITYDLT